MFLVVVIWRLHRYCLYPERSGQVHYIRSCEKPPRAPLCAAAWTSR